VGPREGQRYEKENLCDVADFQESFSKLNSEVVSQVISCGYAKAVEIRESSVFSPKVRVPADFRAGRTIFSIGGIAVVMPNFRTENFKMSEHGAPHSKNAE
jgi:hypothetical protein